MGKTLVVRKKVVAKHAVETRMKNGKMAQKKVGPPLKFEGPNAEVRVDLGATLNMGNYEALRLGVSLLLPCDPSPAKVEEAFKRAVKFTEEKLDKMIQANKGEKAITTSNEKGLFE